MFLSATNAWELGGVGGLGGGAGVVPTPAGPGLEGASINLNPGQDTREQTTKRTHERRPKAHTKAHTSTDQPTKQPHTQPQPTTPSPGLARSSRRACAWNFLREGADPGMQAIQRLVVYAKGAHTCSRSRLSRAIIFRYSPYLSNASPRYLPYRRHPDAPNRRG